MLEGLLTKGVMRHKTSSKRKTHKIKDKWEKKVTRKTCLLRKLSRSTCVPTQAEAQGTEQGSLLSQHGRGRQMQKSHHVARF